MPTGPIIFHGFEFFSSLAHKKLFSCPFTLRVCTELYQFLWEWLEDGLILNVILAETNCPALQHCQKGAVGDLLIFVPIDALRKWSFSSPVSWSWKYSRECMSTLALDTVLGGLFKAFARCSL